MERAAPHGHIFDQHLHTYERVRVSLPLFAAVMAIATRFFHQDVFEMALDLAETNVARALRRGEVDIPLVQALLVLVTWKRPADRTAYHKIGLVARLLAQLRVTWDIDRGFSSLEEEREHVNVERTLSIRLARWPAALTAATELSYSILLRLPSFGIPAPDLEETQRWAKRHAHLGVPGDMYKAHIAELWQFHFSDNGDLWFRSADEWAERQAAWRAVVKRSRASGLIPRQYLGSASLLENAGTVSREFLGLKLGFGSPTALLDAIEAFVECVKGYALSGDLQFYPEYILSGIVLPAILAYHARSLLTPAELVRARSALRDLCSVFDDLPDLVTRDHALGGVQRSYRRLHEALESWGSSDTGDNPMRDLDAFLAQIGFMLGDEAMGRLMRPEEPSAQPV